MSEVRNKAVSLVEEELGGSKDNEYGFGEWIEAKDRAIQRVSVFIDRTNKESESDLREFWINVKNEILDNL